MNFPIDIKYLKDQTNLMLMLSTSMEGYSLPRNLNNNNLKSYC